MKIAEEKQKQMGRWGFLEDMGDTPYRIFTNSPDIGKKEKDKKFGNCIAPDPRH